MYDLSDIEYNARLDRSALMDYIQKKIVFDSEADMSIPAYLLIPKDIKPNETRPGILAAHGVMILTP